MSWDREFDFPVPGLATYRDAAAYIMKLSKKEQGEPHWQLAGEVLLKAAELNDGWTMLAHMAMLQALSHGKPRPERPPRRKAAKKYNIVR